MKMTANEMLSIAISGAVTIAVLIFALFPSMLLAAPEDNGWKVYRTFEYNIVLWEKETRENFTRYAVTNGANIDTCLVTYVYGNSRTRVGLQKINLLPPGAFLELGFVTYTTGSKPGSAKWAVTLILLEDQCSLSLPDPQLPDPPLPLS